MKSHDALHPDAWTYSMYSPPLFVFYGTGLNQMRIYGLKKVIRQTAVGHNRKKHSQFH